MKDRQQYVDYNGCESEPYYTWSGVSQGSNLGPLEFIIMVNDLPEVVRHGTCLLFADDLKLLLEVKAYSDLSGIRYRLRQRKPSGYAVILLFTPKRISLSLWVE